MTSALQHWQNSSCRRLFGFGFIALFMEMALIRYLGANIPNLGYFPNIVLIATFLGLAIGFSLNRHIKATSFTMLMLIAVCLFSALIYWVQFIPVNFLNAFKSSGATVGSSVYFSNLGSMHGAVYSSFQFVLLFCLVACVFVCLAIPMAALFQANPPLKSYLSDIGGSIAGVVVFTLLSFLQTSPWLWFLCIAAMLLLVFPSRGFECLVSLMVLLAIAIMSYCVGMQKIVSIQNNHKQYYLHKTITWSPYQKIEAWSSSMPQLILHIWASGISHQAIVAKSQINQTFYSKPYEMITHHQGRAFTPNNVLIIGAGSGNDVVEALIKNAKHIDAVEIDPVIAQTGFQLNPANPYQDPRVHVIVNDGRAYLQQTHKQYDLIIFALTDSLVKISGLSQLRLENYLFTLQSLASAKSHLTSDGYLFMYNYYRQPWLVDRLMSMVHLVFGDNPMLQVIPEGENTFSMIGIQNKEGLGATPSQLAESQLLPTDNWPFVYTQNHSLTSFYLWPMLGIVILIGLLLAIFERIKKRDTKANALLDSFAAKGSFLLMGVGFALLQSRAIMQFGLLFGTTWMNVAWVSIGVLLLILCAIGTAYKLRPSAMRLVILLLVLTFALQIIIPVGAFLSISSLGLRLVVANLYALAPLYLSSVLFSLAFKCAEPIPDHVYAWNLYGVVIGVMLEYLSLAMGYQAIIWLIAALYVAAFMGLWIVMKGSSFKNKK
jgi:hypothetical protein